METWTMTSLSKFPLAKKRGRPAGLKKKPAVKNKSAAQDRTFKQSNMKVGLLELKITALELKINSLEHMLIQCKVIIDYLETKLENK